MFNSIKKIFRMSSLKKSKGKLSKSIKKTKGQSEESENGFSSPDPQPSVNDLIDQIRLLKLENNNLRQQLEMSKRSDVLTPKKVNVSISAKKKIVSKASNNGTPKAKGCKCTGVCNTKRCGCVKESLTCGEFCKCPKGCQNQSKDDKKDEDDTEDESEQEEEENKENKESPDKKKVKVRQLYTENKNDLTDVSTEDEDDELPIGNSAFERLEEQTPKSKQKEMTSFSPETSSDTESGNNVPARIKKYVSSDESNIDSSPLNESKCSESENQSFQNTTEDKTSKESIESDTPDFIASDSPINDVNKGASLSTNIAFSSPVNDNSSQNDSFESSNTSSTVQEINDKSFEYLNPMKPKHDLKRSPVAVDRKKSVNMSVDDILLPLPIVSPVRNLTPPREIFQAEVDWDEHKAQLVQCQKCKRNFYPHRIKIHEKSCQNN